MTRPRPGALLLLEIQRRAKEGISNRGEMPNNSELIEAALDNLHERREVVAYLDAFLSRCLTGSVPDPATFDPS